MSKTLLQAEGVTAGYGDVVVLRGVCASLSAGGVAALIGPNGSGKSTLIKTLLGQLPSGGAIRWDGLDVGLWRRRDLARFVAYLPQSPAFEAGQSVGDALRLGRAPYWGVFGLESPADERAVRSVADDLGLAGLLHRRMDEISGGQRQRVFLGRCMAQGPRAMLLDEPNTFLDLRHQIDLYRMLRRLAAESAIGVLMASHDLNLAGAFADQVILLNEGVVAAAGTPEEVLRPEVLEPVYGVAMERIDREGRTPVVVPRV